MGDNKKPAEAKPPSLDQEEAEELRCVLQTDEIAPVDTVGFGKRVAQIIHRAAIAYWSKH